MNTQIPLYRAKKIDSDEYIEGNLLTYPQEIEIWIEDYSTHQNINHIDPSTLAIHFPDMLANDSNRLLPNGEKDLRIFASLNEDGKGGDILFKGDTITPIVFRDGSLRTRKLDCLQPARYLNDWKITGVQK